MNLFLLLWICKIHNYSSEIFILLGVPQWSIFGPLLFNIQVCDLLLLVNDIDITNYAETVQNRAIWHTSIRFQAKIKLSFP